MSTSVVLSDLFGRSYDQLDGAVKGRVMDFVVKLQRDPTAKGLHLEPMSGARDRRVRTGRVSDFWRAVLIKLPDDAGYILVAVKPHDEANVYATNLLVSVNEVTGAAEIVDVEQLATAIDRAVGASSAAVATPRVMPAAVRKKDLVGLGIADDVADRLLDVAEEDVLFEVAAALPRARGEAVLDLYAGLSPAEVWANLVADEPAVAVDTEDVTAALARPLSRLSFTALAGDDSLDELRAVLEGSLAAWRVWLHPLQRRLATHDGWNGPYKVTGGAGTGKTVTALHRARHLARRAEAGGTVLLTTFTRNLASTVRAQLVQLAGESVTDRVDVMNVDAVASRVLRSTETGRAMAERRRLVGDDAREVLDLWSVAVAGQNWPVDFLREEWSQVVLAQQLASEADYRTASRSGRGRRLSRPQRAEVWQIIERFAQMMRVEGLATYVQQVSEAAVVLASDETLRRDLGYAHAVIDEAQDLHPAHWRLLRALVEPGQDDLFIVGDAHQRIYGRAVPLSRYGIETRGRSRRLTVNYRTSRQILRWCLQVVDPDADDLDGDTESLAGARSLFVGPEPSVLGHPTAAEEGAALAARVRAWGEGGVAPNEIAVFVRDNRLVADVIQSLRAAAVPAMEVDARSDDAGRPEAVRVMTMHRAKGLEFRAIALPHLGARDFPATFVRGLGDEERGIREAVERNLLYVAASRAREMLHVSWSGPPSPILSVAL